MGFQCLRSGQKKMESVSKESCGENRDWPTLVKSPVTTNIQLTNGSDQTNPNEERLDANYIAWTMKHPSALMMFDRMMNAAKGKRIVVFLDYDGTLSPIVADPNQAFMTDASGFVQMRSAVGEVAHHFPTAIISGRCRNKVYEFVQLTNVYYAGSHGLDILAPLQPTIKNKADVNNFQTSLLDQNGKEAVLFQPAKEFLPTIEEIFRILQERTKQIHGVMIENNKFCLSVHFRRVSKEDWSSLEELVKSVVMQHPQFCLTRGRKVMEIRPSIKWDKGHALEYLLDTLGFGNSTDVLPLYIGDDLSDEDAFEVLHRRGQGYPIIVSSIPKDTKASYSLRDPHEVMSFLLQLARWKRNSSSNILQL